MRRALVPILFGPPGWIPRLSGVLASPYADFTSEGGTGRYWFNQKYPNEAAWQAAQPNGAFTRSSSGLYRANTGLLASAGSNAIRFDYVNGLPTVLLEGARTNLALQSQTFGTTWTPTKVTLTADAATAPDGTSTADQIVDDGTTGQHLLSQTITVSTATSYTISVWLKKTGVNGRWAGIEVYNGGANGFDYWFDLTNGAVGSSSGFGSGFTSSASGIVAYPSGWYRCWFTFASATDTSIQWRIAIATADNTSFTFAGDGSRGLILWGAQFEAGASASSYVTTTTGSVTRAADALTITIPSGRTRVTFTFDDNSTQTVTGLSAGAYAIPTTLNRPNIKSLAVFP